MSFPHQMQSNPDQTIYDHAFYQCIDDLAVVLQDAGSLPWLVVSLEDVVTDGVFDVMAIIKRCICDTHHAPFRVAGIQLKSRPDFFSRI
jgi:hypothetical protein